MDPFLQKNEKELLREEFQLVSANLKMIIMKKPQLMNYYQKQLMVSMLKKIIFIKESFDLKSPHFNKLAMSLSIENHTYNSIVFRKGDQGEYFYIVLEGVFCVESDNNKDKRKQKNIYYYPGDSFGEVSLIYDVPRGATIISTKQSSLIKIPKAIFNQCGDLEKSIRYLNSFFENHAFFEKEETFMVRVVSSLSKLVRFSEKQVLVEEGQALNEILFFVKGEAKVYKKLKLQRSGVIWEETIQIDSLREGDVFGEKFYLNKEVSNVKIVSVHRGEYIKVSFKDNINVIETPLYKRIRQNAARFPTDQELFHQYKLYLQQKSVQLQFIQGVYHQQHKFNSKAELNTIKAKIIALQNARLV